MQPITQILLERLEYGRKECTTTRGILGLSATHIFCQYTRGYYVSHREAWITGITNVHVQNKNALVPELKRYFSHLI